MQGNGCIDGNIAYESMREIPYFIAEAYKRCLEGEKNMKYTVQIACRFYKAGP